MNSYSKQSLIYIKYKLLFILILIILGLFSSCVDISQPMYTYKYYGIDRGQNFYETEIEGCEYIISGRKASWGTHKGNCKNQIHLYRSFPADSLLILFPDSIKFANK